MAQMYAIHQQAMASNQSQIPNCKTYQDDFLKIMDFILLQINNQQQALC